jgi:glutamate/aspartate transport system substrate-binding protein
VYGADHGASFRMLVEGRASAFVMDRVLLTAQAAALTDRAPGDFVLLEGSVTPHVEHYGLMMRDADADLKQAVDQTLNQLMRSGEIERLYTRWFEQPIPAPASVAHSSAVAQTLTLGLPMPARLKQLFDSPSDTPYRPPPEK